MAGKKIHRTSHLFCRPWLSWIFILADAHASGQPPMFSNFTSKATVEKVSCSQQLGCSGVPTMIALPTEPPVPLLSPTLSEQKFTETGLLDIIPCRLDPLLAITFIWYDIYVTVATIITTISQFENTTVIESSTYTDVTALQELSKISDRNPIGGSQTTVLDGTEFTNPYGVVYHSPTPITRYDEFLYQQGWASNPKEEPTNIQELVPPVVTVLPSGFYFTKQNFTEKEDTEQETTDRALQSWLVSHPPSPIPIFWSELSTCTTYSIIGAGPNAYRNIVGAITAHETKTETISSTQLVAGILPAGTLPLPTPPQTKPPSSSEQTTPPTSDNVAAAPPPKPNQSPAAVLENNEQKSPPSFVTQFQSPLSGIPAPASRSSLDLLSISQNSEGAFFVGGKSLLPGSSIVESGTTFSLDKTGSTLFLNGLPFKSPSTGSPEITRPLFVPGSDTKNSPLPVASGVAYIAFGGSTYTQDSASEYKIGSQTLTRGSAITVSGTTISLDPTGSTVFIKNTPIPVRTLRNTQQFQLVFGSSTYFQNSASAFEIASQTLTPGGIITVSGTTISLDSKASEVAINNTPLQLDVTPTSLKPQLFLGGTTYTQDSASAFVIGSQTLRPGGVITVSGTTISLDSKGSLVTINNTPSTLKAPNFPVSTSPGSNKVNPTSTVESLNSTNPGLAFTNDALPNSGPRKESWVAMGIIMFVLF